MTNDSYLRNCYLEARHGEHSIVVADGDLGVVYTRLDGYAIIPMEQFEHLRELAERGAQVIAGEAINTARKA